MCGAAREDWRHMLFDCSMYEHLRDLSGCGIRVSDDGRVNVERVLECMETYECFCKYASNVFLR